MAIAAALALAALVSCRRAAPPLVGAGSFVLVELKPAEGELAQLLAGELVKARQKGLRPFLEVSATWCVPCQVLRASLSDPRMAAAFRGTYIVSVDLDAWERSLERLGYAVDAVPVFFQIGEGGRPAGARLDGSAWSKDEPAEMAPPLARFFSS